MTTRIDARFAELKQEVGVTRVTPTGLKQSRTG
jgi:hypothetical protein